MPLRLMRFKSDGFVVECPDGSELRVCIAGVREGQVTLWIDGPQDYRFVRDELKIRRVFDEMINERERRSHDAA